jgi:uncharacterized metal-binding protein (TIGR02443 family)
MRRFIAGAVCPACRAVDRTLVQQVGDERQRRCVACGHTEALVESHTPEPATRLAARATNVTPAQPVRLIEPDPVRKGGPAGEGPKSGG